MAGSLLSVSEYVLSCAGTSINIDWVSVNADSQPTLNWHIYQPTNWPIFDQYPTNTQQTDSQYIGQVLSDAQP